MRKAAREFKNTMMYSVITEPFTSWRDNDIYHFILKIPYILLVLTFGIVIALILDVFEMAAD